MDQTHKPFRQQFRWTGLCSFLLGLVLLLVSCGGAPVAELLPPLTPEVLSEAASQSAVPVAEPGVAVQGEQASTPGEATPAPPTATPMPTSTPFPEGDLDRAIRQLAYEGRVQDLIALAEGAPSQVLGLGPEALSDLAQAYAEEDRPADAIAVYEALIGSFPDWAGAWGALGDLRSQMGHTQEAVAAYRRMADLAPESGPYARFKAATLLREMGDPAGAAAELAAVDLSSLPASRRAEVMELLALSYRGAGDYEQALATYDGILSYSQFADYRALLNQYRGVTLVEAGRVEEARPILRAVVRERPQAYGAYLALERLIELGDLDLSPNEQAATLYYAKAYLRAIEAADRAIEQGQETAQALLWKGWSLAALGRYDEAVAAYDEIITAHGSDPLAGDAWMGKAAAAASLGGDPAGIYHEFVRVLPTHARAPEALWRTAVSWERSARWELAREYYQRLVDEYPSDSRVPEARFRVGLASYALGQWQVAVDQWSVALDASVAGARPRLQLWVGLAQEHLGAQQEAHTAWDAAASALPWGYHGLRARDRRQGIGLVSERVAQPPLPLSPEEWEGLHAWARGWWEAPAGAASAAVADHPLVRCANAAWAAGWGTWARESLTTVRAELKDDAPALLDLAQHAEALGMYDQAIAAAERVIRLAGEAGQEPVRDLWRLAYPTHYADLVWDACADARVDPLLFMALVRQESRFRPDAVSWAGATGLTQVMPATGAWIAERVGPEPFHRGLLTRPHVSVMQGVWYLEMLLQEYDNDWIAALVGYNAGPTNLSNWAGGGMIADHDLFHETMPLSEPQDYVRLIYEGYRIYQHIYGETAAP